MDEPRVSKFFPGQLVSTQPHHHFETVELWPNPPMSSLDIPIASLRAGTTCLILASHGKCYFVLVGTQVGWIDEHDIAEP